MITSNVFVYWVDIDFIRVDYTCRSMFYNKNSDFIEQVFVNSIHTPFNSTKLHSVIKHFYL